VSEIPQDPIHEEGDKEGEGENGNRELLFPASMHFSEMS